MGRWTLAHALAKGEEYLFDYVFYPFMLYAGGEAIASRAAGHTVRPATGYWVGFLILLACSAALNVAYVAFYDRVSIDWFGFERLRTIPTLRDTRNRWFAGTMRLGLFCYLSIGHSPFFATLWVRSRSTPYAMSKNDWLTLAAAIALANVGWAGCVSAAAWVITGAFSALHS